MGDFGKLCMSPQHGKNMHDIVAAAENGMRQAPRLRTQSESADVEFAKTR